MASIKLHNPKAINQYDDAKNVISDETEIQLLEGSLGFQTGLDKKALQTEIAKLEMVCVYKLKFGNLL